MPINRNWWLNKIRSKSIIITTIVETRCDWLVPRWRQKNHCLQLIRASVWKPKSPSRVNRKLRLAKSQPNYNSIAIWRKLSKSLKSTRVQNAVKKWANISRNRSLSIRNQVGLIREFRASNVEEFSLKLAMLQIMCEHISSRDHLSVRTAANNSRSKATSSDIKEILAPLKYRLKTWLRRNRFDLKWTSLLYHQEN